MSLNGISRRQIESLIAHRDGLCVSVYLPTARKGADVAKGHIQLKNLLSSAEDALIREGMRPAHARDLLAPGRKLVDDVAFWNQERADGLAIFIGEGFFDRFHLSFHVPELLQVGACFNILPLIPALHRCEPHYVLVLDRNEVQLLHCGPDSTTVAAVAGMPKSLDAFVATGYSEEDEVAVDVKSRIHRFDKAIDTAVKRFLKTSKCPLILAGTEEIVRDYRSVNGYAHLLEKAVVRSVKTLKPSEIRELSQPIADAHADRSRQEVLERFRAFAGTARTAHQPERLCELAREGKVDSLLTIRAIVEGNGREDLHLTPQTILVNDAAIATLANHGQVYPVSPEELELPSPAVAVLRY